MSGVCDQCDRPATVRRSIWIYEFEPICSWNLELCDRCARDLPATLSTILSKGQGK